MKMGSETNVEKLILATVDSIFLEVTKHKQSKVIYGQKTTLYIEQNHKIIHLFYHPQKWFFDAGLNRNSTIMNAVFVFTLPCYEVVEQTL